MTRHADFSSSSSASSPSRHSSGRRGRHRSHHRRPEVDPGGAGGRPWITFDGVTEGLLYALLAFSPLAFGVVAAWSREVFLQLVAAAAVVVSAKHVVRAVAGRPAGYRWSWAFPVMLAFLALCAGQLLSLPAAWVRAVSPGTLAVKTELLSDLPDSAALLRRLTITFYPHATVEEMVLVAAVSAIFVIVLDVFREPARIRRLLSAIAGVGLVVCGMAGYQNLTGSTAIYGTVQAVHRNAGPFMNYSHFSQFMNLSIGAALALLLDRVAEVSEFYRTPREVWRALGEPRNAAVWAWALLCVAGPITVLLSMSRMGMISMGVAAIASTGMLFWRGRAMREAAGDGRAWVVVGLVLAVFAVLLAVGFDVVSNRLGTLGDLKTTGRREEMLRDMVVEFRQFPLVGTGLGTHEFVFGLYDHRNLPTIAEYAENEYAQLMEETGAVGVALAGLFLAGLAVSYARATRRPAEPISYVPFGLGFGLMAVLIHSGTDFGQHVPADATLTATFAALMTTFARRPPAGPSDVPAVGTTPPPPPRRRFLPITGSVAAAAVVVAIAVTVGLWAERARAAEALSWVALDQQASIADRKWQVPDAEFDALAAAAVAAAAADPSNVEYQQAAHECRWLSISHTTDPVTGRDILRPGGVGAARRLVDDIDAVRPRCPTHGEALSLEGQINRDVLGRADRGAWEIHTSYRLAPYNATVVLIAGLDAVKAHRVGEATQMLGRYAAMGGGIQNYGPTCVSVGEARVAYDLVKGDRGQLLALASEMPADDPRWKAWIDKCRSVAAQLLAKDAANPDAAPADLADLAEADRQRGHLADGIDLYRRALSAEYGNVGWRLQLAQCLSDADRPAEAAREARVVLQLRPMDPGATALLRDCEARASTRPASAP